MGSWIHVVGDDSVGITTGGGGCRCYDKDNCHLDVESKWKDPRLSPKLRLLIIVACDSTSISFDAGGKIFCFRSYI
jgi:hypothetical protein